MIFLHFPSNAVTKLRIYYPWRDSLLVKPLDMSFIFVQQPHSTSSDWPDISMARKKIQFQPVAKSSFRNRFQQVAVLNDSNRIKIDPWKDDR